MTHPDTDTELRQQLVNQMQRYAFYFAGSRNKEDTVYFIKFSDHPSIDWLLSLIKASNEKTAREARLDQMSKVRSLANELANKDGTMRGSEELRNYHYTNALDLHTHLLDPDHDIRWLEPLFEQWMSSQSDTPNEGANPPILSECCKAPAELIDGDEESSLWWCTGCKSNCDLHFEGAK